MSGNQTQNTKFTEITKAVTEKVEEPEQKQAKKPNPDLRIDKIYRRRVIRDGRTAEALSWVTEDGKHNGCVITKRYNDEKKYIGQDTEFFIEYSDKLARQLIEIANKTNPNPKFYFKDGGRTIAVKEIENFTGDFKELMKLATRGEVI